MTAECLQYLETLLWCTPDCDAEGEPTFYDQGYAPSDFTEASRALAEADLADFAQSLETAGISLDDSPWSDREQLGHDFALSRNGHGAGFFDRGHALGDRLQDMARVYNETYIYLEDGELVLE